MERNGAQVSADDQLRHGHVLSSSLIILHWSRNMNFWFTETDVCSSNHVHGARNHNYKTHILLYEKAQVSLAFFPLIQILMSLKDQPLQNNPHVRGHVNK